MAVSGREEKPKGKDETSEMFIDLVASETTLSYNVPSSQLPASPFTPFNALHAYSILATV